mmetsp:Transcript_99956/g.260595  ORF Transcript_99956/g.260595 Transcript_99956/m.260595 type:complete len:229 (-) Transcript_99956:2-688(-)
MNQRPLERREPGQEARGSVAVAPVARAEAETRKSPLGAAYPNEVGLGATAVSPHSAVGRHVLDPEQLHLAGEPHPSRAGVVVVPRHDQVRLASHRGPAALAGETGQGEPPRGRRRTRRVEQPLGAAVERQELLVQERRADGSVPARLQEQSPKALPPAPGPPRGEGRQDRGRGRSVCEAAPDEPAQRARGDPGDRASDAEDRYAHQHSHQRAHAGPMRRDSPCAPAEP